MNRKIFFIIGLLLILYSCTPNAIERTDYHYIKNETNKKIIHEVICNPVYIDKDTFQFFSTGDINQYELEWIITAKYSNYKDSKTIQYWGSNIYCIDDTSSLHWSFLWGNEELPKNGCNQYYCYFSKGQYGSKNLTILKSERYLTIRDSLLLLMQKDYTMLEKFPKYYRK